MFILMSVNKFDKLAFQKVTGQIFPASKRNVMFTNMIGHLVDDKDCERIILVIILALPTNVKSLIFKYQLCKNL